MAAAKDDLPKKVKIKILSTDGDSSDVFLGFNGKNIVIKRNEVVEIDPEYIGILNSAVVQTEVRDFDANGNKTSKVVEMPRFPYTMVS